MKEPFDLLETSLVTKSKSSIDEARPGITYSCFRRNVDIKIAGRNLLIRKFDVLDVEFERLRLRAFKGRDSRDPRKKQVGVNFFKITTVISP